MDDPSWQRNCETLVRSLQSLDRKTATIRRGTNKLVSLRDMDKEREKIRQTTSGANSTEVQSIQDSMRLAEQFMRQNPTLNGEGVKLMNESQTALESYQAACDAFYKKCISVEESSRGKRGGKPGRAFQDDSEDEGETNRLLGTDEAGGSLAQQHQQQQQQSAKSMFERDLYEDLMAERARETKEIADNVRDINEIFQQIHEMVDEQGVQLEVVDGNLSAAERATRNASQHLQRARQYQETSSRNKFLLIFVIILCIIVFLMLILN